MAPHRTPSLIALELLDCVEANKEATKWDLIKVLGNDTQFRLWIDDFFLAEMCLWSAVRVYDIFTGKPSVVNFSTGC
jgi:hypothetical protein